jgi:hypothetical protein
VNNELDRTQKEPVMTSFKVLYRYQPEEAEENYEKLPSE